MNISRFKQVYKCYPVIRKMKLCKFLQYHDYTTCIGKKALVKYFNKVEILNPSRLSQ